MFEGDYANRKKSFQVGWLVTYPWLKYENGFMYCKECSNLKLSNCMTVGTDNFRTSTLARHIASSDHQLAINAPNEQKKMAAVSERALSKEESAVSVAMRVVFFMCKENIPLHKYQAFIRFLKLLKVPCIEHLQCGDKTDYSSFTSANGFLQVLSDMIDENITAKIKTSPVVTLFTDESTDIVVNHKLAISIRVVDPLKLQPSTHFLTDVRIHNATGKGIFQAIKAELVSRGIPISKVFGLGTDGASTMTGKKNGLLGQFLEANPHIKNTHCGAHRIALVSEQAAQKVKSVSEFRDTITSIYYFFFKSPSKSDALEAIQKVLDDPVVKYKEVHAVRWLSFYKALETVYRTLDSLLTFFESRLSHDAKAAGMKRKVGQELFIILVYAMMDWLQPIMKLSLYFQRKDIDIGVANVNVAMCIGDIEKMMDDDSGQSTGTYFIQLSKDLQEGVYKGNHTVSRNAAHFPKVKREFLQAMIDNMKSRFPETETRVQMAVLGMRPLHFVDDSSVETWGNNEIKNLADFYTSPQQHVAVDGEVCESAPFITCTTAEILNEWTKIKLLVKANKYPTNTLSSLWGVLASLQHDGFLQCPNMIQLACLALTHPLHSCDCERAFSVQNRMVTPLRNRLSSDRCHQLMRVNIEGGELVDFDFSTAVQRWADSKKRRIKVPQSQ